MMGFAEGTERALEIVAIARRKTLSAIIGADGDVASPHRCGEWEEGHCCGAGRIYVVDECNFIWG